MENRADNQPTSVESARPEPSGAGGFLRRNSLQMAGLLNLIGDASLLGAGYKAKDKFMTLAGGLYTGGALALARYGKPSQARALKTVTEDTADFLKQKAGMLPEGTALSKADAAKDSSAFSRAEHYLYRHPADAMLGLYTAGAASMLGSGIATGNKKRIGYGVWSLLVKTTSFLMPEKTDTQAPVAEKSNNPLTRLVAWVREKPMRLFGYGSLITEVLYASSVFEDYKNKKEGTTLGFVTAGAYIASDLLAAVSSKDTTKTDGQLSAAEVRKVEAMAAEAIAKQDDPTRRAALVEEVSGFLAKRPEIGGSRESIRHAIVSQVEHLGTAHASATEVERAAH